jgi:putative tryptophan/tyrosine transport system substrate-binding protein
MRRREFITLLCGAAAAWPLAARAQQTDRVRRIGVLMNRAANDSEGQARLAAFQQSLQQLGWNDGHNVRIDTCWGADDVDRERRCAAELVALTPDLILAAGTLSAAASLRETRMIPIVFSNVSDPVGAGLVDNLSRPSGNITGFMLFEFSFGGKWLELLKQIAPNVTRAAVFRDPTGVSNMPLFAAIQAMAPSLGVEVNAFSMRDAKEIESAITAFARSPNGGLIFAPNASVSVYRDLIITLAARHKLPAIYPYDYMVIGGGLMSYAPDIVDQYRRAAGYVDRILKGEKPADLPVQAPTKFELMINLKTVKALGLTVPTSLLASADKVIE